MPLRGQPTMKMGGPLTGTIIGDPLRTVRPSAHEQLTAFGRYARRLPRFLRDQVDAVGARRLVVQRLAAREERFLDLVARGVYANPGSPYRALLGSAGIELGDVRGLLAEHGLEGALEQLRDVGVYATLDEFKGRKGLERNGVSMPLGDGDFDNPLIAGHYWGTTGGSRGTSRRVMVDLGRFEHEASYQALFREGFGLDGRPFGIYRVIPPSRAGLNNYLYQVKSGATVDRWFNPYRRPRDWENLAFAIFTAYTLLVGRRVAGGLRRPELCPTSEAARVARWLASCRERGAPAVLDAQGGLAVRVCRDAQAAGIDISGSFFRVGGEPLTEAKASMVESSGAQVACHYSMAEIGRIGTACADPSARDDVHLCSDKVAAIQREPASGSATGIGVLSYTTLLPATSKIMINVESGDYAEMEQRPCGCPFGELGMRTHLSGIRSYEKLTTEGNHFLGSDLYALVDEVLPAGFGGGPTDYQLVEEEVEAVSTLSVVVSPTVGQVEEAEVLAAVFSFLREQPRNRLMADFWEQGDSVRVVRPRAPPDPGGEDPAAPRGAERLRAEVHQGQGRRLRFCMLTTFYPPWNFGGDGIQVERLARALADRGHEVTVVCAPKVHRALGGGRVEPPESGSGINVVTLNDGVLSLTGTYLSGRPLRSRRRLERILADGFDVINFHNPSLLGAPALFGLGRGVKLYTVHEQWLLCPSHVLLRRDGSVCETPPCWSCEIAHRRPPQLWRRTGMLERGLAELDALIVPSRTSAELHRRFEPLVRTEVINHFVPDPGAAADVRSPLAPDRPYFLYSGRLEPIKGVATLIEAFRHRRTEDLVIAGEGGLGRRLRREAAGLPHVHFTGQLDGAQLTGLYRSAIAVVMPTLGHEGLPLVPLEAFAVGTPAVVRRFGAMRELIEETGAGLTFDSDAEINETLDRLAGDPALRAELGSRGRAAFSERFSEQAHVDRYLGLVAELSGSAGVPSREQELEAQARP